MPSRDSQVMVSKLHNDFDNSVFVVGQETEPNLTARCPPQYSAAGKTNAAEFMVMRQPLEGQQEAKKRDRKGWR